MFDDNDDWSGFKIGLFMVFYALRLQVNVYYLCVHDYFEVKLTD